MRAIMQVESLHVQSLRRLLGMHRHTQTLITLVEFGRHPLSVLWQRQVDSIPGALN